MKVIKEIIKDHIKYRKQIWKLAKSDLVKTYRGYDGCTSRICRDGKVIGLAVDDGASEAVSDARMEKWIAAVGF